MEAKTLTTNEALLYLAEKTGTNGRYYFTDMDKWRRQGRIKPCGTVACGRGNIYTIRSLNVLAATLPLPSPGPKYRAKSRNELIKVLPNTLTQKQWRHALNYFNGCCATCGRQLNDMFGQFRAAKDHWIPLNRNSDNPGTVARNIVPLCHGVGGCNNQKSSITPAVWLQYKFGKRKAKQIAARIQAYFDSIEEQEQS